MVTACTGSLTGRAWVSREMVKLWLRSWVFDLTSDLSALCLGAGVPCGALRDGPQPGGDVEGGATPEHPAATAVASLAPGSGSQPGPWTPFCRAKAVDTAIPQTWAWTQAGGRMGKPSHGLDTNYGHSAMAVGHGPSGEHALSGPREAGAWAPQWAPHPAPKPVPHTLRGSLTLCDPPENSFSEL